MNTYEYDLELLESNLAILEESNIERTYAKSSNIASFWFNELAIVPDKGTLFVEFKTGAVYKFARVPEKIAKGMVAADSKGKYFWKHIRGKFAYQRVKNAFDDKNNKPTIDDIVDDANKETKPNVGNLVKRTPRRPILSLKSKKQADT